MGESTVPFHSIRTITPPDFDEYKRKKERKHPHDNPNGDTGNKPPDPDHQIDEYA